MDSAPPMRRTTLLLLMFQVATSVHAAAPVELRDTGPWYPYEAEVSRNQNRWLLWAQSTLYQDIDGDGLDEEFEAENPGVYCYSPNPDGSRSSLWWHNLDRKWAHRAPCASLDGIRDVEGNGDLELLLMACTADGMDWMLQRRRVVDGTIVDSYEFAGGEDRDGDGTWDGSYKTIGVIDVPVGSRFHRALVILAEAGFDLQPRGVFALDTESGDVLWEYLVGPRPGPWGAEVVDLNGDGRLEILFSGRAVNNIHDAEYNGTRDDRAMVFVLGDDGRLQWSYTGFRGTGSVSYATVDRDGDDCREVIVADGRSGFDRNRLMALDCQGAGIDSLVVGADVVDLCAGVTGVGEVDLYVAQSDWVLGRYVYGRGGFRPRESVRLERPAIIAGLFDVLPPSGPELIAATAPNLWVLGLDLEPFCRVHSESMYAKTVQVVRTGHSLPNLSVPGAAGEGGIDVMFYRVRRPLPLAWIFSGVAGVLLAALLWLWLRRPRLPLRDLRLQFLRGMDAADHGRLGSLAALKGLQVDHRLWRAGEGELASTSEEYRTRAAECLARSIPQLADSLETASLVGLDRLRIQQAQRALERMRKLLAGIGENETVDRISARIGTEFDDHCDEFGGALERLFAEAQQAFVSDPQAVARRVVEEHAGALRDLECTVDLSAEEAPACCIDDEHLTQVLDNLVENAIRAMAESPERRLAIDWREERDTCVVRVVDTGCGIDSARWAVIMEPGVSSREGGGRGLAAGRSLMRMYGGGLFVRRSSPGEGTVMELRCPVNRAAGRKPEETDG